MRPGGRRGLRAAILALVGLIGACAAEPKCAVPEARPETQKGLEHFRSELADLAAGRRTAPVTILHLGDSHIALDHLTGAMRARWTAEFGDAGRGLPPGVPYRYYAPQGYKVSMRGDWDAASSLGRRVQGPFGLQGYRVSSGDARAEMTIEAERDFSMVEIDTAGGPETGALLLQIDGSAPLRLVTGSDGPGLVQLRVPAASAHRLTLSPAGDGPVRLLGWALLRNGPGIRYDSHGISGATIDVTERWDEAIFSRQLASLAPDLVILGYGTNEGFNDALDLDAYAHRFEKLILRIRRDSPGASIAVLGAFDGARRAKAGTAATCGDGWTVPPKLDRLRETQREVAARSGAFYFDASRVMGRPCGIDQWARATPPLAWPDRVHLKPEGARRMGEAIGRALTGERAASACRK
ncbi:MAG: GDSL-type esterase/lipase family protein [Parvibaculum sp.]|uniref:GDSL-type esterase/lipase family protein n=1 Tax=Parvibaculum sp. TaxID=2024848 RepID=UPI003C76E6CF